MSRKHKNLSKGQIDKIIELSLKGLSSRKICDEMDLPRSRKSSINYVLKDYREGKLVHSGELEDAGKIVQEIDESVALDTLCEHPDWTISNLAKRLRTAQRTNNQLRKVQRDVFDGKVIDFEEVLDNYSKLQDVPSKKVRLRSSGKEDSLVMEVLFNDWQVAKRMSYYNTEVAIARVEEYSNQIVNAFEQKMKEGFTFSKVVVVFNGDIIEADKHDDSILASDRSPAEQIAIAIQVITEKFLTPIAELGVETDVIMLSGNHDWNGRGMMAYEAGKHQLSYPMYRAIEMLLEAKGYDHLKCILPSGWYYVHEFLGKNVLYEHGVGVASTEAAMRKRMQQRGQQLEKHIHYVRLADKHHSQRHHNDSVVLAGAFFGRCDDDGTGAEYSAAAGYAADPSQLVFFHQKREVDDYRNTIIDSLEVQLGHINHKTLKG